LYVKDSPETTPTQHSTLQPASTASTAPQSTSGTSSKSSSNAGQIAGGVVGGIVGAALLAALAFWYLRRQRRRAEAQPSPYRDKPEEAYGLPDTTSGTTMSIGRFYVRAMTPSFLILSTRLLCGCLTYHARTHPTRAPTQNRSRRPRSPRSRPPQVLNTVTAPNLVRTTGAGTPVCRLFDPMMNLCPSPFLVFFLVDPIRVV
jgi:hypothetical protein